MNAMAKSATTREAGWQAPAAAGRRDEGVADGTTTRTGWFRATAPLWPLGLIRIVYGYLWWNQSGWKTPSDDFGRMTDSGLWYWVQEEIKHPTLELYRDFLVNVMVPNWTFFGWMTLITETFIGVTLMLGLLTRLGALIAVGMSANIMIGIFSVPNEWWWTYAMMIMLAMIFLATGAGRSFGVDGFLVSPLEQRAVRGGRVARLARWLI